MTQKIMSDYAEARSPKCKEHRCSVVMPESFTSYCGEMVRDIIHGTHEQSGQKMCDCIIADPDEDKISLIELKYHTGRNKFDDVEHIRGQFEGGLNVLREVMKRARKPHICLEMVLCTNGRIAYPSEQRELGKPLPGFGGNIRRIGCCEKLPGQYQTMSVQRDDPDPSPHR